MRDETWALLVLTLVPKLGRQRIQQLVTRIGSAREVCRLGEADLRHHRVPAVARKVLLSGLASQIAESQLGMDRAVNSQIFSQSDPEYPDQLKQIPDPPPILYSRGKSALLKEPSIAIVGSRRCSAYGSEISLKIAGELARGGLVVTSGLARGIDPRAHLGALEAGGATIAVLGCGVDVIYPKENAKLFDRILESGCLVSEFPCRSYPAPPNFPVRNRIISGLSLGTIITEAARFSGSLITARLTLEQDRELWAVPGAVTHLGSFGPNHLIKQGAHPLLSAQDVLDQLRPDTLEGLLRLTSAPDEAVSGREGASAVALSKQERLVLKLLEPHHPQHIDELLESTSQELAILQHTLFSLELKGLVVQTPGRRFHKRLV